MDKPDDSGYALMESMHGNETAALIFLGAYLGWSHLTLSTICTEDGDPQMWRDLIHAARTLQSVCEPLVRAHERAEADRRHRYANPPLPLK